MHGNSFAQHPTLTLTLGIAIYVGREYNTLRVGPEYEIRASLISGLDSTQH